MSPRSKEQNEQIKDDRKEQLLSAALKVISHKGLAATKIGDIASAAKLSHGLVYHYFKSKDDIYIELVHRAVTIATNQMLEMDRLPLGPLDRLRAIASTTLTSINENVDGAYYFYLMVLSFASDSGPEEAREIMRGLVTPMEVVYRAVVEGQAMGTIWEGDPMEYTTTFWASIQGLAIHRVAVGNRFQMPDSALLIRMFEKR